jgi:hypothetical protein
MTEQTLKSIRTALINRLSDLLGPPPDDTEAFSDVAIYQIKAVAALHGFSATDIQASYFFAGGHVVGLEASFEAGGETIDVRIRPEGRDMNTEQTIVRAHR